LNTKVFEWSPSQIVFIDLSTFQDGHYIVILSSNGV